MNVSRGVWKTLLFIGIGLVVLYVLGVWADAAHGQSFPEDCGIEFSYTMNVDTVSLTLTSDSLVEHFFLSEHTAEPVQFVDCFLDGIRFLISEEEEHGSIYEGLFTKRFVIDSSFNHLVLRYYNPDVNGKMNWVATIPAFGVLGNIGNPRNVYWIAGVE